MGSKGGDIVRSCVMVAGLLLLAGCAETSLSEPNVQPSAGGDRTRERSLPYRSYTVLKAFAIPAGLYGAHSATFFVTPGVPAPSGNPGHSEVRFIENGSCVGATCGMR